MNAVCRLQTPLTAFVLCLFGVTKATAVLQHDQHAERGEKQSSAMTGRLVDSTWFVGGADGLSDEDRVSRASANIANGVPAAIIPDNAKGEKEVWALLTNPTVLAPYAGKEVKVEGRLIAEMRAIVPAKLYVADADNWREVQLAAPPEEPTKAEPADAEHPAEHEKHEAARKEEAGEHSHQAEGAGSTTDIKSGGDHAHDEEHRHWLTLKPPPLHPLLVNFTVGLFPAAVLADWLGRLLRRRSLNLAAWWMLLFAAVVTPLTALAGWFWHRELGDMGHPQMEVHEWLGISLAVALPLLAVWRGRIYTRARDPSRGYLMAATVALLALALQGHLGATMSFGPHSAETGETHGHGTP